MSERGWRQTPNHADGSPLKVMTATRWRALLALQNPRSISRAARSLTLPPAHQHWLSAQDPASGPPREQALDGDVPVQPPHAFTCPPVPFLFPRARCLTLSHAVPRCPTLEVAPACLPFLCASPTLPPRTVPTSTSVLCSLELKIPSGRGCLCCLQFLLPHFLSLPFYPFLL